MTVFGFDAGQGLTEHRAARAAVVQVIKGRLRFTADGEQIDAGPGFWLHTAPDTPHVCCHRTHRHAADVAAALTPATSPT